MLYIESVFRDALHDSRFLERPIALLLVLNAIRTMFHENDIANQVAKTSKYLFDLRREKFIGYDCTSSTRKRTADKTRELCRINSQTCIAKVHAIPCDIAYASEAL